MSGWQVRFHPLAVEDLSKFDKSARRAILKAVRVKLTTQPDRYGEPLRRELFGLWKLRIGDHRVIYDIRKQTVTVLVLKIGARRDSAVYLDMLKRLKHLF